MSALDGIPLLPEDPDDFLNWFEGLAEIGPGQDDALFDWLATSE